GIEIGKEVARRKKWALVIGDAGDLETADPGGLHVPLMNARLRCGRRRHCTRRGEVVLDLLLLPNRLPANRRSCTFPGAAGARRPARRRVPVAVKEAADAR